MKDPSPRVSFNRFGENAIELSAYYWIEVKAAGQWSNTEESAGIVSDALAENGIESNVHVQSFNDS
jgi:small-conductance mechanosensitive channel